MRYSPSLDVVPSLIYTQELHPGTFVVPKRGCLTLNSVNGSRSQGQGDQELVLGLKHTSLNGVDISRTQVKKQVSFHDVEIRQYERLPGDNPSVSHGVPISIGWKVVSSKTYHIDEYEGQVGVSRERRQKRDLLLSEEVRERLLHDEWGYSFKQLFEARVLSSDTKKKRIQTLTRSSNSRLAKFDEKLLLYSGRIHERLLRPSRQEFKKLLIETEARNICLETSAPKRLGTRRLSDPSISSWTLKYTCDAVQSNLDAADLTTSELKGDSSCGANNLKYTAEPMSNSMPRSSSVPFFFHSSVRKQEDIKINHSWSVDRDNEISSAVKVPHDSVTANNWTHKEAQAEGITLISTVSKPISRSLSSPSFTNMFERKVRETKIEGNPKTMSKRISKSISLPSLKIFSKQKQRPPGSKDQLSSSQYVDQTRSLGLFAIKEEECPESLTF